MFVYMLTVTCSQLKLQFEVIQQHLLRWNGNNINARSNLNISEIRASLLNAARFDVIIFVLVVIYLASIGSLLQGTNLVQDDP